MRRNRGHLLVGGLGFHCVNQLGEDLILQRQQVSRNAGKFLAPMAALGQIFQIDGDAQVIAGTLHRAVHDQIHAQVLRDLGQRRFRIYFRGFRR